MHRRDLDHYAGCLLGGAAGDAMGAPIEFDTLSRIRERYGHSGLEEMRDAVGMDGEGLARFTDDTQMTLFTAEGLLRARNRGKERDIPDIAAVVHNAYFRWLYTQGSGTGGLAGQVDGWLISLPNLFATRAPGHTCMSALRSGIMGTPQAPVNNSKGCGGIMRAAPVGLLFPPGEAFSAGCTIAALTHGHPSGYLAAGCLASVVSSIIEGAPLDEAVGRASDHLAEHAGHEECLEAMGRAVSMAGDPSQTRSPETIERLGEGWVAEEALAISIYAALACPEDYPAAVRLAINHGGDSDSTGSITGNIIGALLGMSGIPPQWTKLLEMHEEILAMAADMLESLEEGHTNLERYPAW